MVYIDIKKTIKIGLSLKRPTEKFGKGSGGAHNPVGLLPLLKTMKVTFKDPNGAAKACFLRNHSQLWEKSMSIIMIWILI